MFVESLTLLPPFPPMPPIVEVVDENEVDAELDARIRSLLRYCFPDWQEIFKDRRVWHQTKPICGILARDGDAVVGHAAIVVRTITTTWNFRYNVASVQGVCVRPEHQHSGLGKQLIQAVLEEAKQRGFPFAILYCKEPLVPYYVAQGWKLADESMVMWNKRDLPVSMRSNCPMYYELNELPFPEGPLDVHSPSW